MSDPTGGSRLGEHAVFPGSFNPVTEGHLDIVGRARHLFARVTVLVAVNSDKQPGRTQSERVIQVRRELPAAMNEVMGITTLLLPAQPGLTTVSSTVLRGFRT